MGVILTTYPSPAMILQAGEPTIVANIDTLPAQKEIIVVGAKC